MANPGNQKWEQRWSSEVGADATTFNSALAASGIEQVTVTDTTQALNSNANLIHITETGSTACVCTLPPADTVGHVITIVNLGAVGTSCKMTVTARSGETAYVAKIANQGLKTTDVEFTFTNGVAVAGATLVWAGDANGWVETATFSTTVATAGGVWG